MVARNGLRSARLHPVCQNVTMGPHPSTWEFGKWGVVPQGEGNGSVIGHRVVFATIYVIIYFVLYEDPVKVSLPSVSVSLVSKARFCKDTMVYIEKSGLK